MTSRVSQEIVEVAYLVTAKVLESQETVEVARTQSASILESQEVTEIGHIDEAVKVGAVHAEVVHKMAGNEIRVGSIIIEYAYVDTWGRRQGPAAQ